MKKRLISMNNQADMILQQLPHNETISVYVCDAIIDAALPVFSSMLRMECMWFLDLLCDDKKLASRKLSETSLIDEYNNINHHIQTLISRGIEWAKTHHIPDISIPTFIVDNHKISDPTTYSVLVCNQISEMVAHISSIDMDYHIDTTNIATVACAVIDHWDSMWDEDASYDILMSCVLCADPVSLSITPYDALLILQKIETSYITRFVTD